MFAHSIKSIVSLIFLGSRFFYDQTNNFYDCDYASLMVGFIDISIDRLDAWDSLRIDVSDSS